MTLPTFPTPAAPPLALTPGDVEAMRASVRALAPRRTWSKPPTWRLLIGGPLDWLKTPMDDYTPACAIVGMCTVTETGPVQAQYRRDGEALAFDGLK